MADQKTIRRACKPNTSSPERALGRVAVLAALGACSLAAQPALAQDAQGRVQDRSLEDLIPDAAVADPEAWAAQGVPDAQLQVGLDELLSLPPIDATSPLADLPEITIPWPDAMERPQLAPLAPDEEPIEFATFDDEIPPLPPGSEERISDELVLVFPSERALFPERYAFLARFEALSSIALLDDDGNLARLAAQARDDEVLLNELLRVYGYYDAQVIRSIGAAGAADEGADETPTARFDIIPGPRYRFGAVDLGSLVLAGAAYDDLREAFGVYPGDFISLDEVTDGRIALEDGLAEGGFPFAVVRDPELEIDHARIEGDLTMQVKPGGVFVMGEVVSENEDFLSGEHLSRIARWNPNDLYQRSDVVDLRRAILATGIVGAVDLQPVVVAEPEGDQPGVVNIAASLTPAPLRTLAGSIGVGTEEGIRIEGMWEHRNLFPPEGLLRVRGILGTQEQLAGVTFRRSNFTGRDRILTVDAFASTIDYEAYDAQTLSLTGSFERVSNLLFQKEYSWSVGIELVATRESEFDVNRVELPSEDYFIAALPLFGQIDESDDLLDPTEGWRASLRLSPEASDNDGVQSFYLRSQADFSYYQQVGDDTVLAGRLRLASTPGSALDGIAPSRRLYAGGGGSVRGYGYRQIGPRTDEGDPAGGRSLVEISAEARIGTPFFDGALSVVPFFDAGSVGEDELPDFGNIQWGAGVGVRYETEFGPLRLDVAVPLNRGPNDEWIAVYIGLGQAF